MIDICLMFTLQWLGEDSKFSSWFYEFTKEYLFINVWRKSVFDIYFTEFGTALTTILPILFQYCYKYCYSDSRNLWAVMKAGGLAL
jgi:hypothetical protein